MKKGIRVPRKRTSVITENKERLEERTDVEIKVHGEVVEMVGEALKVWKAKDIVEAIGKGFSFEKSLKLLSEESQLKIVRLKRLRCSKSSIEKIKGRIIGRNGRTRELIQEYSKALVSVSRDDVSIIGDAEEIGVALRAIKMLINGKPHGRVYHYLEQNQPKAQTR